MRRFVSACLVMVVLLAGMCFAQCPQSEVATLDESYVIEPLDSLSISVWKEPEVSGQVVVRNDGKISLPLLKDIEAVGNTPSQLFGNCANRHKRRLQPRRSPIKDFDIDNITEQSALPASDDSNSGQGARRP